MKLSAVSSKVSQYTVVYNYNYIKSKRIIIRDTCFHLVPLFCFRVKRYSDLQIHSINVLFIQVYLINLFL